MTEAQRIALQHLITATRMGAWPVGWSQHQIMAVGDILRDVEDEWHEGMVDTELVEEIAELLPEKPEPGMMRGAVSNWATARAADRDTVDAVRTVLVDFGAIVPGDTTTDVVAMLEILLPPTAP